MLTFTLTNRLLFVLALSLALISTAADQVVAQEYKEPPLGPGEDYLTHIKDWWNIKEGDLRNLPDGYYLVHIGGEALALDLVKKGDSFVAEGGIRAGSEPVHICTEGIFQGTEMLFDVVAKVQKTDDFSPTLKYLGEPFKFLHLNIRDYDNSFYRIRMAAFDKESIGACIDALPIISDRLRVLDTQNKEERKITGATTGSKIEVIPADTPEAEPVMEMSVLTDQTDAAANGSFSSKHTTKGNEENLLDENSYFLRATLVYRDNITIDNFDNHGRNGCNAPTAKMRMRTVVRDSKPFQIKRGSLSRLANDIWPWRTGANTYTPSGKARFDRDVAKYNKDIDDELSRIMAKPYAIDFPPPIVLLHGIRSCYADWEKEGGWTTALLNRRNILNDLGSSMAGLIIFTPSYNYAVDGKWTTIPELKTLRDNMARDVIDQIDNDLGGLLLKDPDPSATPEVYLITHSNGGVVARPISKLKGDNWGIRKIYTLGAPQSGTLLGWSSDYGLADYQMVKYNCVEGGFAADTEVLAIAGNIRKDWFQEPTNHPKQGFGIFMKAYINALGDERQNDGIVYPQGSTHLILCQPHPSDPYRVIQSIRLLGEYPLFHSNNLIAGSPNFLDRGGVQMFEAVIVPDMGLK
jgi:pimeloyl-ACP methyl ester carboxylesterase